MHIFAAEKATFLWGCRGNGEFSVFGHSMNINPFTAITINTNCMTWATASRKCPSQKKVPCLVPKFSHKGCTYLEIEVFDCFFPSRNYIYMYNYTYKYVSVPKSLTRVLHFWKLEIFEKMSIFCDIALLGSITSFTRVKHHHYNVDV